MELLYVTYINVNSPGQLGVWKKINNEIVAMEKANISVALFYCDETKCYIKKNNEFIFSAPLKNNRVDIPNLLKQLVLKYDAFYFRLPGFIDIFLFTLLKELKGHNRKVVIEIPTYPLAGELRMTLKKYYSDKKWGKLCSRFIAYLLHMFLIKRISSYVDTIVTFMEYSTIWKIPCICIDNGVNTEECIIEKKQESDVFRMIFVGNVAEWHGLDRVIEGLRTYTEKYPKDRIKFTIVGESKLVLSLKNLVSKYSLDEVIEFKGALSGPALLQEYCNSDFAVGSLGMHRINVLNGSTIKIKEYCSLGIPFIYAYNEKQLHDSFPFALKVSADDKPIEIEKIKTFYNNIQTEKYSDLMHQYAVNNFDWNIQMAEVIKMVKE